MSEVGTLLAQLAAGKIGLGTVAADFARRTWPTAPPPPASYREAAARELDDPDPIPDGSWGEVEAAYVNGEISDTQYRALFAAKTGTTAAAPPAGG